MELELWFFVCLVECLIGRCYVVGDYSFVVVSCYYKGEVLVVYVDGILLYLFKVFGYCYLISFGILNGYGLYVFYVFDVGDKY